ncbi:MAG: hypothetical protein ACJ71N_13440 [Terriglobales bacterium]
MLLAYGGMDSNFASIAHQPKIFVDDHRLRTRDHQREKQSYTAVVKAASAWMREVSHPASYVNFTEFDQLPLVKDLNQRQIICLEKEGADLLGHHLERIDGTSHPHYLYQQAHPEFQCWIDGLSHRKKHDVVLAMLATGSFWTRECFDAVAEVEEPLPIYVEVYLPTVAHHLGFRVRGYGDQDGFVSPHRDRSYELEGARLAGAWTVHPVKRIPKTATALR